MSANFVAAIASLLRTDPEYRVDMRMLADIAKVCGVARDWLLWGEGDMVRHVGRAATKKRG